MRSRRVRARFLGVGTDTGVLFATQGTTVRYHARRGNGQGAEHYQKSNLLIRVFVGTEQRTSS